MTTTLLVFLALTLDYWLGEPHRFHPLVAFGKLAQMIEQRVYRNSRFYGTVAVLLLLIPLVLIASATRLFSWATPSVNIVEMLILYFAIGWNSLNIHALAVSKSLLDGDLITARKKVGLIVSRDTNTLDETGVVKATMESILENGSDAIFAAIFWFAIAGTPGVVLYRLSNTLDAMWGYRNQRYHNFGWFAARLDDLLNLIPARLTALGYAIVGNTDLAIRCWRQQAASWKSPNAGPVMAAGAGSLSVELGGVATYHGVEQQRPLLGEGRSPEVNDIQRALILIRHTLLLYLLVLLLGGLVAEFVS
ncbi:MAG: adenosylcobinamide-phosphate synthase CbiB [Methylococcales bacterium]